MFERNDVGTLDHWCAMIIHIHRWPVHLLTESTTTKLQSPTSQPTATHTQQKHELHRVQRKHHLQFDNRQRSQPSKTPKTYYMTAYCNTTLKNALARDYLQCLFKSFAQGAPTLLAGPGKQVFSAMGALFLSPIPLLQVGKGEEIGAQSLSP